MLKRKSIIIPWLLSYILILLIPTITGMFNQVRIEKVLESEINTSNQYYLKQIKQEMDSVVGEVKKFSTELAFNLRLQDVMNIYAPITDSDRYKIYELITDMRNMRLSKKSINDFYIYFNKSDQIVSTISNLDSKEFYNILYKGKGSIKYEDWIKTLSKYYNGQYIQFKDDNANANSIMYIRSVPLLPSGDNISGNIVFNIDESIILPNEDNLGFFSKARVLILTSKNEILADTAKNSLKFDFKYEALTEGKPTSIKADGEEYVVNYIDSSEEDWKYIAVMPKSAYWESLRNTRKLTYFSFTLCTILGGILSYFLIRRNYQPVRTIVDQVKTYYNTSDANDNNEYRFIQNAFTKTVDDKNEIRKKLLAQNNQLKGRFIERLLRGSAPKEYYLEALTTFDIKFISDYYGVILFHTVDLTPFIEEDEKYSEYESVKLFQFIMTNLLEEMANVENYGLVSEVNGDIVCLINFKEENVDKAVQQMTKVAKEATDFVINNYKVSVSSSISSVHQTIPGIFLAYNEAVEAMEYKWIMGINDTILFDDVKQNTTGDFYYPFDKEQLLINNIKSGDSEMAICVLTDIFERNFRQNSISSKMTRYLFFDIMGTLLKVVNDNPELNSNGLKEKLTALEGKIDNKKLSKIKEDFIEIVTQMSDLLSSAKSKGGANVANTVKEYILNNYHDENLSISTIAEVVKLHPAYMSKLFKEYIGKGILDYLNACRLEKAIELMKDRKMNFDDISKAVGYTNTRTFSRAFIKIHGVTPGKYRDSLM